MTAVSLRLPDDVSRRLRQLAARTWRSRTFYILAAIREHFVETEFAPARTVEQDATARLGTSLHSTGEDIEGVLSVVLPENLKTADLETIEGAAFRYATHYLDAIEWLSLSERQLARGTETLEQVVRNTAGLLAEHAGEGSLVRVAKDLHQGAGEQTERMAAAICVSAFVFHVAIEDQEHIPPVPRGRHSRLTTATFMSRPVTPSFQPRVYSSNASTDISPVLWPQRDVDVRPAGPPRWSAC